MTSLKATPSRKLPQTPTSTNSKWGRNREKRAALLRVRTGPDCPEDNRRELLWVTNLNCGRARTHCRPFAEQRVRASPEESSQAEDRPSPAGGRRQGGGERDRLGPKDRSPCRNAKRPPVSNQRPPDRRGQGLGLGTRRGEGARTRLAWAKTETGTTEGRRRAAPGESAPVKPLAAWDARTRKAQKAGAAFCSALLWKTRGLEPCATQGMLHIEQPGAWAT